MKIGIDARLLNETGIGRYIRNLILELSNVDQKNTYVVFLNSQSADSFALPNNRWKKVVVDAHWHSIKEQFMMPKICAREHLDILHVPYFNIPILYQGKIVVTMHDLTTLKYPTGKASTLPPFLYGLKLFALKVLLSVGLRKAVEIISVSNTTKQEVLHYFLLPEQKITVTYEGVDEKIIHMDTKIAPSLFSYPYILYVGNAYPHKNLNILVDAFVKIHAQNPSLHLVFVGPDDYFYTQLKNRVLQLPIQPYIQFFGYANDLSLQILYSHAETLVFPSLSEGFGLPALEALYNGVPVACSNISVFHEILGDNVTYFSPRDSTNMAAQILSSIHNKNSISDSVRKKLAEKFNWKVMAIETLHVYEKSMQKSL